MLDDRVQNAILPAVNHITGEWVEMAVKSNQCGSWRNPKSLVNNIELGDLVGNGPEPTHLAALGKNIPDQIFKEIYESHIEYTFGLNDKNFRSHEKNPA